MGYDYKSWKERMSDRQDLSSSLVHLTRAREINGQKFSPVEVLFKILRERTLIGSSTSSGFIRGPKTAVCFQDAPLYSVAQNLKFERELSEMQHTRHRYSGCGLVFSKYYLFQNGCRPVIYDKPEAGEKYLDDSELYRLVALDLSDTKRIVDWSHEREWRIPGNFQFRVDWAAVVLETKEHYREFVTLASKPENAGIQESICGLVVLDALLM